MWFLVILLFLVIVPLVGCLAYNNGFNRGYAEASSVSIKLIEQMFRKEK